MQISLTGFLGKNAAIFMQEFWSLLVDAQSNSFGIPTAFLEKKKQELLQKTQYMAPASVHTHVASSTIPHEQAVGVSVRNNASNNGQPGRYYVNKR